MFPYSDHRTVVLTTDKKDHQKNPPKWCNSMFNDHIFVKDCIDLVCKLLVENSTEDLAGVTDSQLVNNHYADNLEFPESGEQKLAFIPVNSLIINKLLDFNSKEARKKSMQLSNNIKNFEHAYDKMFKDYLSSPSREMPIMILHH